MSAGLARASALFVSIALIGGLFILGLLFFQTRPLPDSLESELRQESNRSVLDRHSRKLSESYFEEWNLADRLELYEFPERLREFLVFSEDRDFLTHSGIDWRARGVALFQNLTALRVVRGASTLDEQVIRMLHPRPRTVWSKLVETIEAYQLNRKFAKAEILEFYMNQVPFARHRRGFAQASQLYFSRPLSNLHLRELLSLVVLIRAPNRFDPYRHQKRLDHRVLRLADSLREAGRVTDEEWKEIKLSKLRLHYGARRSFPVEAFVRQIRLRSEDRDQEQEQSLITTLDLSLQTEIKALAEQRQERLKSYGVDKIAVLVLDYQSDEVLAWVHSGSFGDAKEGSQIDPIVNPHQVGSTLKPFLYAQALEEGWAVNTLIPDQRLSRPVGNGIHQFKNYSLFHYGEIPLYEALANSLNIPAVHALEFVGVKKFGRRLQDLGVNFLKSPETYGLSLALGASEMSLLNLVEAYACLARSGLCRSSRFFLNEPQEFGRQVMDSKASEAIVSILRDPYARSKEFGPWSILRMPQGVAAKTGTSTAYRDALCLAFDNRYVVGIWMGNQARKPMSQITGSIGPAPLARSLFSILSQSRHAEQFLSKPAPGLRFVSKKSPVIRFPTPGLIVARDPRVPDEFESLVFEIEGVEAGTTIEWTIDGQSTGLLGEKAEWSLVPGEHELRARTESWESEAVSFKVLP